jgi:hypothetical protein
LKELINKEETIEIIKEKISNNMWSDQIHNDFIFPYGWEIIGMIDGIYNIYVFYHYDNRILRILTFANNGMLYENRVNKNHLEKDILTWKINILDKLKINSYITKTYPDIDCKLENTSHFNSLGINFVSEQKYYLATQYSNPNGHNFPNLISYEMNKAIEKCISDKNGITKSSCVDIFYGFIISCEKIIDNKNCWLDIITDYTSLRRNMYIFTKNEIERIKKVFDLKYRYINEYQKFKNII